ncbi:MAG TPA: cyclase family protein [Desulfobacteraceae bacterium]|nr:cyclase family protein [Desulfobacteraceae bacterium]
MPNKFVEDLLEKGRVFDLGQQIFPGMPHHPNQPPFGYTLLKKHGDITLEEKKISFCNDIFMMGGHTGTHLDAVSHVACNNRVFKDRDISNDQDYQNGLGIGSIDATGPIVKRGVLLDIPASVGLEVLPHDFGIGENELKNAADKEGVSPGKGDVVLIRTGWIQFWDDRKKYLSIDKGVPGVVEDGARYLASLKVAFTGTDTTAYEKVPPHYLPCHVILLMENGIQIMEMLNLEELSKEKIYEFLFIALPLKIRGGSGSPIRPIAIA